VLSKLVPDESFAVKLQMAQPAEVRDFPGDCRLPEAGQDEVPHMEHEMLGTDAPGITPMTPMVWQGMTTPTQSSQNAASRTFMKRTCTSGA
jgi:hypothetical protein